MNADWIDTTLGDIAEIVSGATPKTAVDEYWNGAVHWATPKDLSKLDGAFIESTLRTISVAGLKSCAATVLPAHSVMLSSRAPIGLVAINTVPMATNQGFKSLIPDRTRVGSKFLYWWLRCHRPQLEAIGNGATFKEISKRIVAAVRIDLPPIVEQRRIASMLALIIHENAWSGLFCCVVGVRGWVCCSASSIGGCKFAECRCRVLMPSCGVGGASC